MRRGGGDAVSRQRIAAFIAAGTDAKHPNLIPVLDGSTDASIPYLVMPRIEGATLRETRDRAPSVIELPVALWIVRQTAEALAALHGAGWVHGDLKPDNLMVGRDGHVTLIDLGFATPRHTARRGVFRGTPQYAAPETLDGSLAALASSDVFSLGRMLWESLALLPPTAPSAVEPVAELVERMLGDDPAHRPTADVIAAELLRIEVQSLANHIGPGNQRRAA